MTAQIDRLTPGDRALLRQAAVLGRSFDEALLAPTAGPPGRVAGRRHLARLARFLEHDAKGTVRFRHALIRDAAYEGLPYRRRRELHAQGRRDDRAAGGRGGGRRGRDAVAALLPRAAIRPRVALRAARGRPRARDLRARGGDRPLRQGARLRTPSLCGRPGGDRRRVRGPRRLSRPARALPRVREGVSRCPPPPAR